MASGTIDDTNCEIDERSAAESGTGCHIEKDQANHERSAHRKVKPFGAVGKAMPWRIGDEGENEGVEAERTTAAAMIATVMAALRRLPSAILCASDTAPNQSCHANITKAEMDSTETRKNVDNQVPIFEIWSTGEFQRQEEKEERKKKKEGRRHATART